MEKKLQQFFHLVKCFKIVENTCHTQLCCCVCINCRMCLDCSARQPASSQATSPLHKYFAAGRLRQKTCLQNYESCHFGIINLILFMEIVFYENIVRNLKTNSSSKICIAIYYTAPTPFSAELITTRPCQAFSLPHFPNKLF